MYRSRPNLQIGYHGCDEAVREQLVTKPDVVKESQESYDWLGHGFYVWENNYQRAFQWALDKQNRDTLITPSVIGVVYQLDYCLDFTDSEFIDILSSYYGLMKEDCVLQVKNSPKTRIYQKINFTI